MCGHLLRVNLATVVCQMILMARVFAAPGPEANNGKEEGTYSATLENKPGRGIMIFFDVKIDS